MKTQLYATSLIFALALSACGGGGGGTPSVATPTGPIASTNSFPLQSGYKALTAAGSSNNFAISGTCTGTATLSDSAPVAATFEGVVGVSVTATVTLAFTNCTPATAASTSVGYYDSNYLPLGTSTPGSGYEKLAVPATGIATSVKVGDTAIFATLNTYTSSTKTTPTGQRVVSYVIEPDTATTAIANVISKSYNTSNQLLFTQQSRYRMGSTGALSLVSVDLQYSTTSTTHLVFTKI